MIFRWHSVTAIVLASAIHIALQAQSLPPNTPAIEHFPYTFSNFIWWSDTELRQDLKQRIPGLGDKLERNSQMESRIRTVLTSLLQQKGIRADVQSIEPSMDILRFKRAPSAPPPSIEFSILPPPSIVVEKLVLENPPPEAGEILRKATQPLQGKPYNRNHFWILQESIQTPLQESGYLAVRIELTPGNPDKDGDGYQVPIIAKIDLGPQYRVGEITADGGPLVQGRDLSTYFSVHTGEIATPSPFGHLTATLRSVYWHAGYPDVAFQGEPILDSAHAIANYHFAVVPGPLYHLRSLKIENIDATLQAKVRELLGMKPGDIYDEFALTTLGGKLPESGPPLQGYGFSYKPQEDTKNHVVDLTLTFFRQ